jgi:serine/threonine-protein kinase ULK2
MAPEILRYEKYGPEADLWSVGAVLYEMAVGKSPFRAHNHIDLLKKIESSKGVRFPDEDSSGKGNGDEIQVVPSDIKQLIRGLLKQKPVQRMSFDAFFASEALAKSKFHRPRPPSEEIWPANPPAPEHHSVIPPEVLDPKAMIPPSKFNFRRTSTLKSDAEGAGPAPLVEE